MSTPALSPFPAPCVARLRRRLLLAFTIALGASLPAQSLGLEVTPYGQQSGVPQKAADELGISMVATPSKQMVIHLPA